MSTPSENISISSGIAARYATAIFELLNSEREIELKIGQLHCEPSADHSVCYAKGTDVINRKEADMGKVVNMSGTKKTDRGPNPTGSAGNNDTSRANFSYRLFLIVDLDTFVMIEWLRESLEAHSYGDVVRQAIRAFAIRFVNDETAATSGCMPSDDSPASDQKLKRLNIRVPGQTKERLDLLKDRTGMSYTDIIVCGLQLLAERAKGEEAKLAKLETKSQKGGEHEATNDETSNFERKDLAVC